MKSTPPCARLTSPGRSRAFPISAAADALWCGARNGRERDERARRQEPRCGVDAGDLERLAGVGRRQDAREAAGQHRLARSGRAGQEQVVAPRRGDLERPPGPRLPAHLREVGAGALVPDGCGSGTGAGSARPAQDLDRVAEVARSDDLDAAAETGLSSALARDDERLDPSPPRRLGHRQGAPHGPQTPVEAELGGRCDALDPLGGRLARHREHGQRDREIEPGPLLALLGRRQVDREPRAREAVLRRGDPASDPLARLLDGAIGEPDDDEARHPVDQVRLDLDAPRRDPHEPERERPSNHPPSVRTDLQQRCARPVTIPRRIGSEGRREVGDAKAVDGDHVEPQPVEVRMRREQHLARLGEPALLLRPDGLGRRPAAARCGAPSPRRRRASARAWRQHRPRGRRRGRFGRGCDSRAGEATSRPASRRGDRTQRPRSSCA